MGTMKKIAITSALGLAIVASTANAAAPADMQKRVDVKFKEVMTRINTTDYQISCRQMASILANAGARGASQKGVELKNALTEAINTTSATNNFRECIPVVAASNASAAVTGFPANAARAGLVGKASTTTLGGLSGLASSMGVSTSTVYTIAGLTAAAATIAIINNNDDDNGETKASPDGSDEK